MLSCTKGVLCILLALLICSSALALNYVVQSEDTLSSISLKYNVSVSLIMRINNLESENIRTGERLVIPNEDMTEIRVTKGDTLSGIALQLDVSEKAIALLNNLDSDKLFIGQKLKIPVPAPKGSHRVLPGETLLGIANRSKLSLDKLKSYNLLENDLIHPGQVLFIAPPRPEGHRVSKGESLWTIARNYDVTVKELISWNNLHSSDKDPAIHPGDVLTLFPNIEAGLISDMKSSKAKTALARLETRPATALKPIPRLPAIGEYFYSSPKKNTQPSTSYWEGATASSINDYWRARNIYAVFRSEAENLPRISNALAGWHIVLDPGHGGLDPGAIVAVRDGNNREIVVTEDEYVYDIALRVYRILIQHGAEVSLTVLAPDHHLRSNSNARLTFVNRKNEVYADTKHNKTDGWRPVGTKDGLDMRKNIAARLTQALPPAKRSKGTLFVSLHADNSSELPEGTAVLYDGKDSQEMTRSKAFAKVMTAHTGEGSFIRHQALRVLKDNPADAAILVEVRNIHYSGNAWALRSVDLRQQDSRRIANGILAWAGR